MTDVAAIAAVCAVVVAVKVAIWVWALGGEEADMPCGSKGKGGKKR